MIIDHTEDRVRPTRKPLRYSVGALLMVMTAACVLLAIFRPERTYSVTAYLKVVHRPALASSETRLTPQEIEGHAKASLALATSTEVIDPALASLGAAKLTSIMGPTDPAIRLIDRLSVSYPGDGEILQFRLQGMGGRAEDDQKLLQAVVDAYQMALDRKKRLAKPGELTSDATLLQKPMILHQSR